MALEGSQDGAAGEDRQAFLAGLSDPRSARILEDWFAWARPEQLPPAGPWTTWLYMGGRGAGKTRAGAEWIKARVTSGIGRRIALVASTAADARHVMIEGESGLLTIAPLGDRPVFEPSNRRLIWPNGAIATLFSAEQPDSLRGPQHDTAWCDELAKWKYLERAWDNLQLSLRLGKLPRQVITTTPRALAALKAIMERSDTATTRGTSYDNRANLAPSYFAEIIRRYEGTRFGRQEINAELLEDVQGALWTRAMLDAARLAYGIEPPQMARVVVGVDPSGTRGGDDRDAVGIIAAGKGLDGLCYVLADFTCALSPAGWGRRVAEAVSAHKADCVVAEANFGGAMVESVLQAANTGARVKMVTASRGKIVRAEPIAALYEQQRVKHAGLFPELEDQLCAFTTSGYVGDRSPDHADALIWALTELALPQGGESGWVEFARRELTRAKARLE
ncbi:MAG TPA: terminase family protein [Rhizomicrobium sp.]|nr:terminase family protein [Rhizomicrobium sp.]